MWILESDSGFLDNQRIWLRPGKKYLLGRTKEVKRGKGEFFIDERSVSRRHVTLSVSPVKPGNGSSVHTRSELSIKDERTKFGTELDGIKIESGAEKVFQNDEHTFRLGNKEAYFRVKWQPVVLTFSFSKKDTKDGKDPLAETRAQLEQLDIKTIIPYIADTTTHVVQTKRNTAKGLQALINAKYIVTNSFIDALIEATTPNNLNEDESTSLLEEDFDKHWPDATRYLPAKSKEPNERPAEYFAPNSERNNIFEGYSFVFCDQVQFETLLPPITNAGGKAFKVQLQPGRTSPSEIVRFVKEHAGEKGLGEFEDDSIGKGVVVVRFRGGSDEHQQWALDLGNQVALALGQRLIEQSEFMDAILSNDAKILRKALEVEDEQGNTVTASTERAVHPGQSPALRDRRKSQASQPPPRPPARGPVRRRFKAFDVDDDETILPDPTQTLLEGSSNADLSSAGKSQRAALSRRDSDSQMDVDPQASHVDNTQTEYSKKVSLPDCDEENDEDIMDSLFPTTNAIKRRRLEVEEEAKRTGKKLASSSFLQGDLTIEPPNPKRVKEEINIKDAVRERRDAEEEVARRDEEKLRETLEGMSVEEMKKLAVVEEMEVPVRPNRPQRREATRDTDSRWDPVWNGRRNFKKFRRQGESNNVRRGRSVMVPLEEVKKKDFGIGEGYWDDQDSRKKKRKDKDRTSQSQSQTFSSAKSQHTAEAPSELMTNGEEHELIDVDAPRTTRHSDHTGGAEESNASFQAVSTKRAAPSRTMAPPAKKQRLLVPEDSESESDDDELKFRFKKKR